MKESKAKGNINTWVGEELYNEFQTQVEKAGYEKDSHLMRALIRQIQTLTAGVDSFDVRDLTLKPR